MPAWSQPPDDVLRELRSGPAGLDPAEAGRRAVESAGRRRLGGGGPGPWRILAAQFLNPLVLMLLVAAAISVPVGSWEDAVVILAIVLLSGGLGFAQEYAASNAVAKLLAMVRVRATVRRGGALREVPLDEVVPGDVVLLGAGSTVPGDARLLVQNGLQVDESPLTGESFPVSKQVEAVAADAPPGRRRAAVFLGTHVVSGTAEAVVWAVGRDTELGHISERLEDRRPPTEFDLGVQRFGNLLVRVSAVLVLGVFAVNVGFHREVVDSFLFSVALAVGLVPELLPAIVTVNLAQGARRLGAKEVVVKRLAGIEDLGAVDVLCSDKTGTLTAGQIRLVDALGADGTPSARARLLGWLNARFESGYANPIDAALRAAGPGEPGSPDADPAAGWTARGEVPYDFSRKRLSVVLERGGRRWLVMKGQLAKVLEVCTEVEGADGVRRPLAAEREAVEAVHRRLAGEGLRLLGVAIRELPDPAHAPAAASEPDATWERDLAYVGALAFDDPPKEDVPAVLAELRALHVRLKVLTGDDHRVAAHLWQALHGKPPVLVTGEELRRLGSEALQRRALDTDVFAEVDPGQKERVVAALRRAGRVVAFLGDGINDAPALRAADVGISVDTAADIAREAADVVLRRRDLGVVANGVREGRRTMVNTLKYVWYTSSANFGNMASMAFAALFLPFLPLLPKQILLNNFLSDIPALTVAADHVDESALERPGRWRTEETRRFMFVFGGISSIFDLTTFAVLYRLCEGDEVGFRTGWFVESLLTELFVLWVLRTRLSVWRSPPRGGVFWSTLLVAVTAVALPYVPAAAALFSLEPMPPAMLGAILGITSAYIAATELAKRWFFRRLALHQTID